MSRIDRFVASNVWVEHYDGEFKELGLGFHFSDHRMLVLQNCIHLGGPRPPFNFEMAWLEKGSLLQCMKQWWGGDGCKWTTWVALDILKEKEELTDLDDAELQGKRDQSSIVKHIVEFYEEHYTEEFVLRPRIDHVQFQSLDVTDAEWLEREITNEEVKNAINCLEAEKSPGPK
ncbi:hypothetical protein FRX31_017089, partial [Thalictrum thalictroides]